MKLPCKITRGMFSNEVIVSLLDSEGETVHEFVNKSQVEVEAFPSPEQKVSGFVKMYLYEENDKHALASILSSDGWARYIRVNKSDIIP